MNRIVYNQDGLAKIIIPSPNYEGNINDLAMELVPSGIDYEIIDVSELPQDRTFRNAWEKSGKQISINMDKARNIQMDKIRALRDKKLKELDIETMKGNDVQAQKQVLRDIPQTFDLSVAKTPEELKALWPDELKGE